MVWTNVIEQASRLFSANISCFPCNGKEPLLKWGEYRERIATYAEATTKWPRGGDSLALVCGEVSGGLEVLDFDCPLAYEVFLRDAALSPLATSALEKCVLTRTPSGGYHVKYRRGGEGGRGKGNRRLAVNEHGEVKIETRGEGGFALCYPSPNYENLRGDDEHIPLLSPQEADILLALCQLQDERIVDECRVETHTSKGTHEELRPGDEYNRSQRWRDDIQAKGWKYLGKRQEDGVELWQRPGKQGEGISATWGIGGKPIFYVFSSNAHPLLPETGYTPFSLYAHLYHEGDFREAAKALQQVVVVADVWEAPIALSRVERLDFPLATLPSWLAEFCSSVAESTQTPLDMGVITAFSVFACSLAKKYVVQPQMTWREGLNLYTIIAMPPGSKKSAVHEIFTRPLYAYEQRRNDVLASEKRFIKTRKKVLEGEYDRLAEQHVKAKDEESKAVLFAKLEQTEKEIKSLPNVHPLHLAVSDITSERICQLLTLNKGRLGVFSADAGDVFGQMGGKYNKGGGSSVDVYLKGYSGDVIKVSRVSREEDVIYDPALTLCLAIQPAAIVGMTNSIELEERGLLGRFLWCLPPSNIGYRRVDTPPYDLSLEARYTHEVERLLEIPFNNPTPLLPFTPQAFSTFCEYREKIEIGQREGEELFGIVNWAGKLSGNIARIAGIFTLLDGKEEVGEREIERACSLIPYLTSHARLAYSEMRINLSLRLAEKILAWVKRNEVMSFKVGDLLARMHYAFSTLEDVKPPLALLEERGYLRKKNKKDEGERKAGRPAGEVYLVNPYVFSEEKGGGG